MTNVYDVLVALGIVLPPSVAVLYYALHKHKSVVLQDLQAAVDALSTKMRDLDDRHEATRKNLERVIESRMYG